MARTYDTFDHVARRVVEHVVKIEFVQARDLLVDMSDDDLTQMELVAADLLQVVQSARQKQACRAGRREPIWTFDIRFWRHVRNGLKLAIEDGLIEEERDDHDKARVKKFYSIKMRPESGVQSLDPGPQTLGCGGQTSRPRTNKKKDTIQRQEIDTSSSEIVRRDPTEVLAMFDREE